MPFDPNMTTVRSAITHLRKRMQTACNSGWTDSDIAKAAGLSGKALRDWQSSDWNPTCGTALAVEEVLAEIEAGRLVKSLPARRRRAA